MSWIMLVKKVPTEPSPPKMSLHWAVQWPDDTFAKKQANTCTVCGYEVTSKKNKYYDPIEDDPSEEYNLFCNCEHGPTLDITPEDRVIYTPLGKEHNWTGAMKINYKNADIRVFPDEFNFITAEKMKEYLGLGSHELVVSESKPVEQVYDMIMNTDQKNIYEAALLDGSVHNQAVVVAAGGNIFIDEGASDEQFPVLGWYRCIPQYARMFCNEWEMKE